MTSPDIASRNERFGLQRRVHFAEGRFGMIKVEPGFEQMICIEPANALAKSISLLPGEHHRLGQTIKAIRY